MDEQHARRLLTDERARVEALLLNAEAGGRSDRAEADERDGMSDGGERLTEQYTDDAVAAGSARASRRSIAPNGDSKRGSTDDRSAAGNSSPTSDSRRTPLQSSRWRKPSKQTSPVHEDRAARRRRQRDPRSKRELSVLRSWPPQWRGPMAGGESWDADDNPWRSVGGALPFVWAYDRPPVAAFIEDCRRPEPRPDPASDHGSRENHPRRRNEASSRVLSGLDLP